MRFLILAFITSFLVNPIHAQFVEIGGLGGAVSFNGDVHPSAIFINTRFSIGAMVRYHAHPHFTIRAGFQHGTLEAKDTDSQKKEIRERNLSFRSKITEVSLIQEINLAPFIPQKKGQSFSPYIGVGVSLFWFNPTTLYDGKWIELQPLGTEGQGLEQYPRQKHYKLFQPAIPIVLGLKYNLGGRINIGLDIGYRFTFTDYIDDVSTIYVPPKELAANGELAVALSNRTEEYTGLPSEDRIGTRRGNSNNTDGYLVWGVTVSFNLYGKRPYKEEKKRQYQINKWL
ncbi:MAG: hypothetical protein GY810_07890 [Aureispira sp.]|nr:hypothetical protein [Aureispira sp.]